MEGKETSSPSLTSESSILDLPSVCDLAEHFLPPHSSENSQELYPSGDAFPSPPTGLVSERRALAELLASTQQSDTGTGAAPVGWGMKNLAGYVTCKAESRRSHLV